MLAAQRGGKPMLGAGRAWGLGALGAGRAGGGYQGWSGR